MKTNIQNITFSALMTAILCIVGPVVLPIGPVPMSFANLVIYLTIILLDKKRATSCVAVYLLLGLVGIPVFAGFTGGVGKLFGPTGGYLVGYLVLTWVSGEMIKRRKNKGNMLYLVVALTIGTMLMYVLGTLWLMYQSNLDFQVALGISVFPFLLFDILKIVVAVLIGNAIKIRIKHILF